MNEYSLVYQSRDLPTDGRSCYCFLLWLNMRFLERKELMESMFDGS